MVFQKIMASPPRQRWNASHVRKNLVEMWTHGPMGPWVFNVLKHTVVAKWTALVWSQCHTGIPSGLQEITELRPSMDSYPWKIHHHSSDIAGRCSRWSHSFCRVFNMNRGRNGIYIYHKSIINQWYQWYPWYPNLTGLKQASINIRGQTLRRRRRACEPRLKQAKRAKREEVLERQRKRVVELWVIVLKLHMEVQWFPIGLLYIDLYTIIILPNLLGSIIPELIINQQGFWTLPKWLMDVLLW